MSKDRRGMGLKQEGLLVTAEKVLKRLVGYSEKVELILFRYKENFQRYQYNFRLIKKQRWMR